MAQWGPTNIATNTDDAMGDAAGFSAVGYLNNLFIDDLDPLPSGWKAVGLRFSSVNIANAVTITAATLSLPRINDNSGAAGLIRIKCVASNTPLTWSTTNRPYNSSVRSAYVDHTFPADATTQNISVSALIQDLLSAGYSYTGNSTQAISFVLGAQTFGLPNVSWRSIAYDTNGAINRASLSISYATTTSAPSATTTYISLPTSASAKVSSQATVSSNIRQYTITAITDNCMADAITTFCQEGYSTNGGIYISDNDSASGWDLAGFRFANVNLDGLDLKSITANLVFYRISGDYDNDEVVIRAVADNNPYPNGFHFNASSTATPGTASYFTVSAGHSFPSNGDTQIIDVSGIVKDLALTAGYSYSGANNSIVFGLAGLTKGWGSQIAYTLISKMVGSFPSDGAQLRIYAPKAIITSQTAFPESDLVVNAWLPNIHTSLWQQINESTPDDSDYIYSTTFANECEIKISNVYEPKTNTGHSIHYRFCRDGDIVLTASLTISLYEGSTLIAQKIENNIPTSWTTTSFNLSQAEAESITSYRNLRLKFST